MKFPVAFALLLLSHEVCADSTNATSELIDRLFKDYNPHASPYSRRQSYYGGSSIAQSVNIRVNRAIIASVNERDWTVSILVTANYIWKDPRLVWDPVSAGGVTGISMKTDAVWTPDVYPCESQKISPVFKDITKSVNVANDGTVYYYAYDVVNYLCEMKFDAFPFDSQECSMCFAFDGLVGTQLALVGLSSQPPELKSNSEWDIEGAIRKEEFRIEQDGIQSHRVVFRFKLVRNAFFWIFLIIIPTLLFCLVTLVGIFFYEGDDAIPNAASIGLSTMTSLMLVVTILADALDTSDNLPGLGWFVFIEIFVVCFSVVALHMLDLIRTGALKCARKKPERGHILCCLISKKMFRAARFTLFLITVIALIMNAFLHWS